MNHYVLVGMLTVLLIAFFVNEGRLGGATVSSSELVMLLNKDNGLVLDIRDQKEFNAGHIVDSINIPFSKIDSETATLEKYKSRPVVIVCKMGQHAGAVGRKLRVLGFDNVKRLGGGIAEWRAASMPLVK